MGRELLAGLDARRLDLDGDDPRRQCAEPVGDRGDEVDPHVARDGVAYGALYIRRRERRDLELPPLDGPGLAAGTPLRSDQNEGAWRELPQSLRDCDSAVRQILEQDILAEIDVRESLEHDAADVEISLIELEDGADDYRVAVASQRRKRTC